MGDPDANTDRLKQSISAVRASGGFLSNGYCCGKHGHVASDAGCPALGKDCRKCGIISSHAAGRELLILAASLISLSASLVTTGRVQQCFNVSSTDIHKCLCSCILVVFCWK